MVNIGIIACSAAIIFFIVKIVLKFRNERKLALSSISTNKENSKVYTLKDYEKIVLNLKPKDNKVVCECTVQLPETPKEEHHETHHEEKEKKKNNLDLLNGMIVKEIIEKKK